MPINNNNNNNNNSFVTPDSYETGFVRSDRSCLFASENLIEQQQQAA
jgi:hypothetical protein